MLFLSQVAHLCDLLSFLALSLLFLPILHLPSLYSYLFVLFQADCSTIMQSLMLGFSGEPRVFLGLFA